MSTQVSALPLLGSPAHPDPFYPADNANKPSPGGKKILTRVAGKDASKQFWKYHNEGILKKFKGQLQVGSLDTKKAAAPEPAPAPAPKKEEVVKPAAESGAVVPVSGQTAEDAEPLDPYGDLIPFADPTWYQGVCLPYFCYTPTYKRCAPLICRELPL